MENRQRRKGQAERQGWTTRTAAWLTTSSTTSPTTSSTTSPTTSPTIFTIFKATTTKVAAFGRHHKRGGAAFGRATSFVVSFVVVALNMVNIVELVVGLVVELVVGLIVELVVSQAAVLVVRPCRSACPF